MDQRPRLRYFANAHTAVMSQYADSRKLTYAKVRESKLRNKGSTTIKGTAQPATCNGKTYGYGGSDGHQLPTSLVLPPFARCSCKSRVGRTPSSAPNPGSGSGIPGGRRGRRPRSGGPPHSYRNSSCSCCSCRAPGHSASNGRSTKAVPGVRLVSCISGTLSSAKRIPVTTSSGCCFK